jgi:hypothetical protein
MNTSSDALRTANLPNPSDASTSSSMAMSTSGTSPRSSVVNIIGKEALRRLIPKLT